MADAGKYAVTTHDGDNAETEFLIGFSYLDVDHIYVEISGETVQVLGTNYTVSSDGLNVVFTSAPPTGSANITFTRQTPTSTLYIDFVEGAGVTASNMDTAILQCLYRAEEVEDMI